MPRNVRNFWVTLNVDGKKTKVASGPVAKDGGFTLSILMRENGSISDNRMDVEGYVDPDGTIRLSAWDNTGQKIWIQTER